MRVDINERPKYCNVWETVFVKFQATQEQLQAWLSWLVEESHKEESEGVWGPNGGSSGLGFYAGSFHLAFKDRIVAKLTELGIIDYGHQKGIFIEPVDAVLRWDD